jgi:pimeloyl-ACP methyl ester carboxylesterase
VPGHDRLRREESSGGSVIRGRTGYPSTVRRRIAEMATVDVDGMELFYRERGSGSSILLIHGSGGNADVWGMASELLSEQHRVVAYDRRGFSRSVHAPVSDPRRHRDDAATLLRALDAAAATVVGWSSGGVVALDLAIHNPELVSALVLQEPPLHLKRRPGPRMLGAIVAAQLLNRVRDDRVASEAFFRWAFRYTSGGTGYDRIPDAVRETLLSNGNPNMAEFAWATGEHLTKAQLAGIGCPVVCLAGELSERSLARATRYIAGLVPHARLKPIAGAGHAMHLERPGEFAAAVHEAATDPRGRIVATSSATRVTPRASRRARRR